MTYFRIQRSVFEREGEAYETLCKPEHLVSVAYRSETVCKAV